MCALLSKFHFCHDGVCIWPLSYFFLSRGFLLFISRPQFLHRRQSCCDKQRKMNDKLSLPGRFFQGNCYNFLSFFSISLSSKRKNIASVFQRRKATKHYFFIQTEQKHIPILSYISIYSCKVASGITAARHPKTHESPREKDYGALQDLKCPGSTAGCN